MPGAIQVQTSYMALAFLLSLVKTRVVIDGMMYELPWGTNVFPVAPGGHRVRVAFKYVFMWSGGAAPAAGWHPDPTGRHELRYWDGRQWTADVSDQGVTSTDPA